VGSVSYNSSQQEYFESVGPNICWDAVCQRTQRETRGSVQISSSQRWSEWEQLKALGCLGSRDSLRAFARATRSRAYFAGVRRDASPFQSTRDAG